MLNENMSVLIFNMEESALLSSAMKELKGNQSYSV